jgi:hypothetical protein
MSRKKSEFLSAAGKMIEVWQALINAVLDKGGTDKDVRRVFTDKKLADDLANRILTKRIEFPSSKYVARFWPGREVVEDVVPSPNLNIGDFEFIPFLRENENWVSGEEMRKRAVEIKANLGFVDAVHLLRCEEKIPEELRRKFLVFPGTVLRDPDGDLCVVHLNWDRIHWCLNCSILGPGVTWHDDARLARCR